MCAACQCRVAAPTGSRAHPRTPLPCAPLPAEISPLVIFVAKRERSQPSPTAGVARCCWPVPHCRAVPGDACTAPQGAALISAWELHLRRANSNPLKVEGCTHSPLCFAGIVWVGRHLLHFFPLISVWHWKLFVKSWRDYCSCFPSLE